MPTHVLRLSLIVSIPCLIFWNALPNAFHFDDYYLIVDNPGIQNVQPVWRHFFDPSTITTLDRITQYRPLLPLSLSLNYHFTEQSQVGFRATNLALHILSALLVFAVLRALDHASETEKRNGNSIAFWAALLYAVHPVSGFPINYLSARDLILMNLLILLSLWSYCRWRFQGSSRLLLLISWSSAFLALFAKTDAVAFPFVILALELTLGSRRAFTCQTFKAILPFALLVLAEESWKRWGLGFSDFANAVDSHASPVHYALTQSKLHLLHYLRNFVYPFPIRLLPASPAESSFTNWQVWAGVALIFSSLALAFRLRKSQPLLSFCILTYWSLLIPTSSVFPLFYALADYRPYPSSPFLFYLCSLLAFRFAGQNYRPLMLVLLIYFSGASLVLNRTWATAESAWSHSVRYGAEATAHMNFAKALADKGDLAARTQFEVALQKDPSLVLGHINYGLFLIWQRQVEQGLEHLKTAVNLQPDWAQTHYWLGKGYLLIGRKEEALVALQQAVDRDPDNVMQLRDTAVLAQQLGRHELALHHAQQLQSILPDAARDELLFFLKGFSQQQLGKSEEAVASYQQFLSHHPNHIQARANLIYALVDRGECQNAALQLTALPENSEQHAGVVAAVTTCGNSTSGR